MQGSFKTWQKLQSVWVPICVQAERLQQGLSVHVLCTFSNPYKLIKMLKYVQDLRVH